jgi:hypothetical protein
LTKLGYNFALLDSALLYSALLRIVWI